MLSKAADQPYNTMTESEQFVIIPWVASWSSAVIIIDPKWGLQYLFIATLLYLNPLRYLGDFYFSHKALFLSPRRAKFSFNWHLRCKCGIYGNAVYLFSIVNCPNIMQRSLGDRHLVYNFRFRHSLNLIRTACWCPDNDIWGWILTRTVSFIQLHLLN